MGKSSGGYGSLVLPMLRPGLFDALAAISADAAFEYAYLPDFPIAWRTLRKFDGSIERFYLDFRTKTRPDQSDFDTLNVLAMAAAYSARPDGGLELPFDERGAVREDVWARWLALDPVRMLPAHLETFRAMRLVSIECGLRDEYRLYVGAQLLHGLLDDANIPHRFELFEGGHSNIQHRSVDAAIALAKALAR